MELSTVQWLLDTREIWRVSELANAKQQMLEFKDAAALDLEVLPNDEQEKILGYHFARDAKLSLGSHLLKRLVISRLGGVRWADATSTRDDYGKPGYTGQLPSGSSLAFNVSHQAGLVALIATTDLDCDVGIDVVCVNERNDYAKIEKEGFFHWVDMHSDVFAPSEVEAMKFNVDSLSLPGVATMTGYGRDAVGRCQYPQRDLTIADSPGASPTVKTSTIIEAKLRRFYAFWCLREAYVKMTGEALLADWLPKLEFRRFKVPAVASSSPANAHALDPGEVVSEIEIYFDNERLNDVCMELRAFGCDYMVASAITKRPAAKDMSTSPFPHFQSLQLETDLRPWSIR